MIIIWYEINGEAQDGMGVVRKIFVRYEKKIIFLYKAIVLTFSWRTKIRKKS